MARQPKYRRHTVRDLGFSEHDGKRVYFPGSYDSDESVAAYLRFVRDLGFLVYRRGESPENTVTIPLLVARFNEWAQATFPGGRKSRAGNLKTFSKLLIEFAGIDLAVNFTPLRLKAFQQWMIDDRKSSRRYINDATAAVRQMFKWAVSEELIPVATYQALMTVSGIKRGRTAARETEPKRPVEWKHVDATLKKLKAPVRDMVQLHWLTGVRSQSLCMARVNQFDCSKQPWEWRPRHKTEHLGHMLVVFIGPKAQKVLATYLKGKSPTDYLFQPRSKTGGKSHLYRSRYDSDTYRRAVERAAKLAKVPHWTPHQLRHARGTLVRERFGLEGAQAALGHAKIDATQIYAQKQMAMARQIAQEMG